MRGWLADVFFGYVCKSLIERWFLGEFRFAQMALESMPRDS